MKYKSIDKLQENFQNNTYTCFYCELLEISEKLENINIFSCPKCKRAYYCSLKCMKKMKSKHESICHKYYQNYNKVNEIVDEFITKKI